MVTLTETYKEIILNENEWEKTLPTDTYKGMSIAIYGNSYYFFDTVFKENVTFNKIRDDKYQEYYIGKAIIGDDHRVYILKQLEIEEAYQGVGHGTKIMEYILNKYTKKPFVLQVMSDNTIAIKLYKKFGFYELRRDMGLHGDTEWIYMKKDIK